MGPVGPRSGGREEHSGASALDSGAQRVRTQVYGSYYGALELGGDMAQGGVPDPHYAWSGCLKRVESIVKIALGELSA